VPDEGTIPTPGTRKNSGKQKQPTATAQFRVKICDAFCFLNARRRFFRQEAYGANFTTRSELDLFLHAWRPVQSTRIFFMSFS
jgi:hypothetical protein